MKVITDTMKEKGIRDDYVVLVGEAPLDEARPSTPMPIAARRRWRTA